MTKNEIITFVVKKFNEMSKTHSELLISVFGYLNPKLETVIHNKHELACYLADKWYTDNITNEVVEAEWNKFYDYYNDVDGLFHEDENGYLI